MTVMSPIPRGWSVKEIPSLAGKVFLVTGGNSGLGFATVKALSAHGAHVILAARNVEKANHAKAQLKGSIEIGIVDVADLESVRSFAASITHSHLDGIVLNAGVMATPLKHTRDGFELQMATNHIGHFALSGLLLNKLQGSRIVSVSSMAHRMGDFDIARIEDQFRVMGDDALKYRPWATYGRTKLANLIFTHELQRRSDAAGWKISAIAAHPGWSNTNLQSVAPEMQGKNLNAKGANLVNRVFAQSAEMGALPQLAALTIGAIPGGAYVGPDGLGELRGHPKLVRSREIAYDQRLGAELWRISEEVTGVRWQVTFDS